jgi:opacity protein-like surface antigen
MVRFSKIGLLAAGLFLACGAANVAKAADKLFPEDAPVVYGDKRQEFGTGWYLRGDIGWSRDRAPAFSADGTLSGSLKTRNITSISLGYGYKFNNWFRADVTAEYRSPERRTLVSPNTFACPLEVRGLTNADASQNIGILALENQCRSKEVGELKRGTLLFNGYLDLGTWAGVTPYVGAGVGVAYGRTQANYDWIDTANNGPYRANLTAPGGFPIIWLDAFGNPARTYQFGDQSKARKISQTRFNLAWALMAGVAIDVSKNAKMELGYRYMNMGKWGNSKSANTAHDFRVGFRYQID